MGGGGGGGSGSFVPPLDLRMLTMLNLDVSCSENCVDPNQLTSGFSEKSADQDTHCFQ